jgi:hypothetical protein
VPIEEEEEISTYTLELPLRSTVLFEKLTVAEVVHHFTELQFSPRLPGLLLQNPF